MKRKFVVFSTESCAPCRQLFNYCQENGKHWDFIYPGGNELLFNTMRVATCPTLTEVKNGEYTVLAVGLGDIYKMMAAGLLEDWPTEIDLDKREATPVVKEDE